jgi:transcriptional regulator with GAF, ATPase, and Fis domain
LGEPSISLQLLERPMTDEQKTRFRVRPTLVKYAKTRVTVSRGPDQGVTRELAGNPIRVGSSLDNDLVLTDHTVSRRHCAIEPVAGGVRVRDEGSTNGVVVAGMHVFDAVLTGTVSLELGESVLLVEPLAETIGKEQSTVDRFGDLLGGSPRMRELYADLARIATADISLLIEGETGTGKELVAESVHRASARAESPMVVFDCGAVVPNLAESELFGHERGAFTGAVASRPGVFEQAEGGTIFLDELGELSKDLQPKLLRVLERHEVKRIGGQRTIPVNVRLIAATNRNLAAEVQRGNFREDLYFRIAAAHVNVPPLRDRMQDLPMLVEHFLARLSPPGRSIDVPKQVWEMFGAHRWPGNVRELNNAVQRLMITPERPLGPLSATPPPSCSNAPGAPLASGDLSPLRVARREANDAFERQYVLALLARSSGNVTRAAAIAEVSRQMMQRLMRKHAID